MNRREMIKSAAAVAATAVLPLAVPARRSASVIFTVDRVPSHGWPELPIPQELFDRVFEILENGRYRVRSTGKLVPTVEEALGRCHFTTRPI